MQWKYFNCTRARRRLLCRRSPGCLWLCERAFVIQIAAGSRAARARAASRRRSYHAYKFLSAAAVAAKYRLTLFSHRTDRATEWLKCRQWVPFVPTRPTAHRIARGIIWSCCVVRPTGSTRGTFSPFRRFARRGQNSRIKWWLINCISTSNQNQFISHMTNARVCDKVNEVQHVNTNLCKK